MYESFGLYHHGAWHTAAAGETFTVTDPATEDSLGEVPASGPEDAAQAIASAQDGMAAWRKLDPWERGRLLDKVADLMDRQSNAAAEIITREVGKPLAQSRREWSLALDQFRWFGEETKRLYGRIVESRVPGGRIEVTHEPIGIVAAFTAWNFPALLLARKVAPALAAGCAVIARPSKEAPGSAMFLVQCCHEAGLPAGVVNLISGMTDNTYRPLMQSPHVRKVTLTGSTEVGRQMIRDSAATVKRVTMELGGNAPSIIFDDADIESALDLSVPTKFANAGQVCVAPDRFLIHERIFKEFVEGFVQRTKSLRVGNGLDASTQLGPLISRKRLDETEAVVAEAIDVGGRIETGGRRPANLNKGYFFEPTVITGLADDATAWREENFAPIAVLSPFSRPEEAISRANATDYGLSAYVFTRRPDLAREVRDELRAGMVGVNTYALAAAEAPFGGVNHSGMGREGGAEAVFDYLNVKMSQVVF